MRPSTTSHDPIRSGAAGATLPVVRLLGEPVHAVTESGAIEWILSRLAEGRGGWVATHNLDHLRRLKADAEFSALCATADLRTADGRPLIWASKLQGTPLPERVAGSDLTLTLTAAAASSGRSIYLLGGNPGTAERAAAELVQRYPGLKVAGTWFPPIGYDKDPTEMRRILEHVSLAAPDIVYVAVGSPKQELLIRELLRVHPKAWYVGVGISLSFVTGEVRRAPAWMRGVGLEWVHRFGQEPKRLFRRYFIDGVPFAVRLLAASAIERFRRN